ncbi:hypothetical protein K501DRAFT_226749 [Backusella circina FSU 941]|nr:hypothetical protein K501DRAFT_226749 [Backusella circina FSU 941]
MDADGPSGFRNAPVTKCLVPVIGGCSALAIAFHFKPHMALPQLVGQHQFWRLFTNHWAFSNISSTVMGTWLIYRMKIVERRYGSAKYSALLCISFVASTLLQTGVLACGSSFGLKSILGGPYAMLFAVLYQFQNIVPPSYQAQMLGVTITDKTYVSLAAIHLLFSSMSASSIVPCICGWVIGAAYASNVSNIKKWRFPVWTSKMASKYILPLLATNKKLKSDRRTPSVNTSSSSSSSSNSSSRRRTPPQPQQEAEPLVSEENIDTMMAMFPDYTRDNIKDALVRSNQDLNHAADILLQSGAN